MGRKQPILARSIEWPPPPPVVDGRALLRKVRELRGSRRSRLLIPAVLACFVSLGQGPAALLACWTGMRLTAVPASGRGEVLRLSARSAMLAGSLAMTGLHLLYFVRLLAIPRPIEAVVATPASVAWSILLELASHFVALGPLLTLLLFLRMGTGQVLRGLLPGTLAVALAVRLVVGLTEHMPFPVEVSLAAAIDRLSSVAMIMGWIPPLVQILVLSRLGRPREDLPVEAWAGALRRMGLEVEQKGSRLEARGRIEGLSVELQLDEGRLPGRVALRVALPGLEPLRIETRGPDSQVPPIGDPLLDRLVEVSGPGAPALVLDQHAALLPVLRGRPGSCIGDGALISGWTYDEDPASWVAPETLLREATALGKALLSRKTVPGLAG